MSILSLVLWIVLCQGVGIVSGLFTVRAIPTWYKTLNKPSFNPPNWVFGPVWTILYLMMAVAAWIVSESPHPVLGISLFLIQLALNFLWSLIFFGAKRLGLAFTEILFLWTAIASTTLSFFAVDSRAGLLMVPYLLWCTFAAVLNGAIAKLN